ncbi:MAG: mepM 5 [Frankiales bacterium]|nr:mepM 5 [Frankiales bacterium]
MGSVRVSPRVLKALPVALLALGLTVAGGGLVLARHTTTTTAPVGATPTPTATPVPPVAALKQRIPTTVLVTSDQPFTPAQVKRLMSATGAKAALLVSAGKVFVEKGKTTALGVDPSTFRAWTPKGTAESTAVWQSVAAGDGAVAHVVGRAYELPLGGEVLMQGTFPSRLRVGSFTTTAIPGIGLVVDSQRAEELGLTAGTGLLLSAPQRPSEDSARLARAAAPGTTVTAVQYVRTNRVVRGGWVFPIVGGHLTSGFGYRMHPIEHVVKFHDGIDVGAPYGAPVYAMSDGVVLYAGPARGFGQEVVLSHPGGVTTVYGHVSRIVVESGPVHAGQVIALVGSEGESTGPHLHAEVRVDDRAVDPIGWLRAHGVAL